MAKAKETSSAVELMRQAPRGGRRGGAPCVSCRSPWAEQIRELFEAATVERPEYSLRQLLDYLRQAGYPNAQNALANHIRNHEPDLWERWNGRSPDTS